MYAPLAPLLALVGAVAASANPGLIVLVLLALLVTLAVVMMSALAPPVVVQNGVLSVLGREQLTRGPGGTVDLSRLCQAHSVSYHGGLVSSRGLALFRTQIELEDALGGRAMFGAWGWIPKREFQTILRRAVVENHVRVDPMTWWRLGFRNDRGARVSFVRRFI